MEVLINVLIDLIMSTITFSVFVIYINLVLGKKLGIRKSIVMISALSISFSITYNCLLYIFGTSGFLIFTKQLFTIATMTLILTNVLDTSWWKCLLISIMFLIINVPGEFVAYSIMSELYPNTEIQELLKSISNYLISNLIAELTTLIIILIIKHVKLLVELCRRISNEVTTSVSTHIIMTAIIISIIMSVFYSYNISPNKNTIFVLLLSFSVVQIVFSAISMYNVLKLKTSEEELNHQIFYNKTLDPIMRDLRVFKHDINNILSGMNGYVQLKDWDGLQSYWNSIRDNLDSDIIASSSMSLLKIKNAGIVGLLSSKIRYAFDNNVKLQIQVTDQICQIDIKMLELCKILGILIDNAIEAASESNDKYVKLTISEHKGFITFIVDNSFCKVPDVCKIFEEGFSTKNDNRGLGLSTVQSILRKNKKIILNTEIDNNIFTQYLMIDNKGGQ